MPKFNEGLYTTAIWNQRDNLRGTIEESLQVVVGIVDACRAGVPAPARTGQPIGSVSIETKVPSRDAPGAIQWYLAQAAKHVGSYYVGMVGESHDDRTDQLRAAAIADRLGADIPATMVVYEKLLAGRYPAPNVDPAQVVTEEGVIPNIGINIRTRSVVLAGYLVLCLLGGTDREVIVCFAGEEHGDIFGHMETIIATAASAASLADRYRYYQLLLSYRTRQDDYDPPLPIAQ